ncbi:hypothetical protein ACLOJK_020041 [Asimina triloba]
MENDWLHFLACGCEHEDGAAEILALGRAEEFSCALDHPKLLPHDQRPWLFNVGPSLSSSRATAARVLPPTATSLLFYLDRAPVMATHRIIPDSRQRIRSCEWRGESSRKRECMILDITLPLSNSLHVVKYLIQISVVWFVEREAVLGLG